MKVGKVAAAVLALPVGVVVCTVALLMSFTSGWTAAGCYGDAATATAADASSADAATEVTGWDERKAMDQFGGRQGPDDVCRPYAFGQCTWWTCMRQFMLGHKVGSFWGNGADWAASGVKNGWTAGKAVAGGIVSYAPGALGADGTYGHVGVIEKVEGDRVITSEKGAGYRVWSKSLPLQAPAGLTYLAPPDGSSSAGSDADTGSGSTSQAKASCRTDGGSAGVSAVDASYEGDGTHASPAQARAIAKQLIPQFFPGSDEDAEFSCLVSLWNGESGWRWDAANPGSGAYGIPQSLPASKMASAGSDWKDNAGTQIKWGLAYIRGRADYGTPCKAWEKWQSRSPHWY